MNPPAACGHCQHDRDGHRLLLLDISRMLGIVLCATPKCTCGATWKAVTAPSSPEQIAETRGTVRNIITAAGMPLPHFLQ